MATPAFIYAFDNMGPERFTQVCGLLLASRYKGFLLGGVGPDGGIDGELDNLLGEWRPETRTPLIDEALAPGELAVFQFKHKVTARVGQANTRRDLLGLYHCTARKTCELHRELIVDRKPAAYVLVTNVEVNAPFRTEFIARCQGENNTIARYQVIGLDELETWMRMEPQIGHLYLPTIFGEPKFQLRVEVSVGGVFDLDPNSTTVQTLNIAVYNVGIVPSYIASIQFRLLIDGAPKVITVLTHPRDALLQRLNPSLGDALEPGRRHIFYQRLIPFAESIRDQGTDVILAEVIVKDEINNIYSIPITAEVTAAISAASPRPVTYGEIYK